MEISKFYGWAMLASVGSVLVLILAVAMLSPRSRDSIIIVGADTDMKPIKN